MGGDRGVCRGRRGRGLALSLATDWRLLFVGAACLLAAWLYTGGPRPYGYLGLGELFVFIFFGLVATIGTVYVQELRVTALAVLAGCGIGFLATAILVLNNLRDIDTDAAAGKRTLATRIGRERTLILLLALVCAAFAVPIVMLATRLAGITIMAMHFGIPIAAVPVRTALRNSVRPELVGALKRMAGSRACVCPAHDPRPAVVVRAYITARRPADVARDVEGWRKRGCRAFVLRTIDGGGMWTRSDWARPDMRPGLQAEVELEGDGRTAPTPPRDERRSPAEGLGSLLMRRVASSLDHDRAGAVGTEAASLRADAT